MITPEDIGARPPLAVNHVAITVPDIDAAIDWYGDAFGFHCIMGPRVLDPGAAATAETGHILGPRFRRAYQAHLLTASGIGIELFQFVDPPVTPAAAEIEFWRQGLWHLCLTDRDIASAVRRIVGLGGAQVSPVTAFVPGRPYELVYCRDPWGTVIEIMTHSYAEVFSAWPQPGATQPTEWLHDRAVGSGREGGDLSP
jgi:catechol 2,3-dioxygenase-like lactoylglutathione lyase family enzyme